jgi:hypothetical protein
VVDRVEPGLRTVERCEERQHVDPGKGSRKRLLDGLPEGTDIATEPVGISDELDAVAHVLLLRTWGVAPDGADPMDGR